MTSPTKECPGVLVLAPFGRDAEVACEALSHAGIVCTTGLDFGDLLAARPEDLGAIVLTEELLTPEAVRQVDDWRETQASWSSLSVVLLVDPQRRRTSDHHVADLDAFCKRPDVIVLQRPIQAASFVSVLRAALSGRRRQYQLRDELDARARAEARATTIADEMKHRVKNAFSVAAGVASQTFRNAETLDAARQAFSGRLASMARAQDLLSAHGADSADLGSLVEHAIDAYRSGSEGGPFEVDGPQVRLHARVAMALAMTLHELATNAVKYGALSVPSGRVSIVWRIEAAASDKLLILEWRERGGPPASPPERRGYGSRLIEQVLALDLAGGAQMVFEPKGLICIVRATINDVEK